MKILNEVCAANTDATTTDTSTSDTELKCDKIGDKVIGDMERPDTDDVMEILRDSAHVDIIDSNDI